MMTGMEEEFSIPIDLSVWVPAALLSDWIMSNVATLDWTNAALMDLLRKNPDFEPKALLNTMTLAYTLGVFPSDEIARRCSEDSEFRSVRPKLPPLAGDIKRFRKENTGLFKWTLMNALTLALKTRFNEGEKIENLPAGLRRYLILNATERLDIARHLDRGSELL